MTNDQPKQKVRFYVKYRAYKHNLLWTINVSYSVTAIWGGGYNITPCNHTATCHTIRVASA